MNSRYPRIHTDGRIAYGADIIAVDGNVVGRGFEPQFWKNDVLLVKGLDDKPWSIDLKTLVQTPLGASGPDYTHLRAGGGQWIGAVVNNSLFKVACSRSGQKAWLVEHNHDNNDHSLFLDGLLIIRGSVHNPRVEDGYLVWTEGGGGNQRTWGRYPNGNIVKLHASGSVWEGAPVPVLTPTGPWVVVTTNTEIRAYPWGKTQGYIIVTGEDQNFEPDAVWRNNEIQVVWSNANGTLPVPRRSLKLDAPRNELNPPPIVPINRQLWFGFFMFSNGPKAPGNSTVAVRRVTGPQSQPFVATIESAGIATGQVLGYWVSNEAVPGTDVTYIENLAKDVYAAGYRPVAYWDARLWPRKPELPKGSWVCVQAYQLKTESTAQYESSVRNEIARVISWGYDVVFIPQCYVQLPPTKQVEDLRLIPPVAARVARDFPQVVAMLPFHASDGRRTGLEDHPEVRADWEKVGSTIQTPPFVPFNPNPPVPVRTYVGDLIMFSKFIDPTKQLIAAKKAKPVSGTTDIFTLILPNDRVFSCQGDGTAGDRDPGTEGPWERCRIAGSIATFETAPGTYYSWPFVEVENL